MILMECDGLWMLCMGKSASANSYGVQLGPLMPMPSGIEVVSREERRVRGKFPACGREVFYPHIEWQEHKVYIHGGWCEKSTEPMLKLLLLPHDYVSLCKLYYPDRSSDIQHLGWEYTPNQGAVGVFHVDDVRKIPGALPDNYIHE